MKPLRFHQKDGSTSAAARVCGVVGILLVAWLVYLSADPEAHERMHHHSDGPDHHCVISAYATGEALFAPPICRVGPPAAIFFRAPPAAALFPRAAADLMLLPSCGPPGSAFSV